MRLYFFITNYLRGIISLTEVSGVIFTAFFKLCVEYLTWEADWLVLKVTCRAML